MIKTVRWLHWSIASLTVTCIVTCSWFAGQRFADPSGSSWLLGLASDLGRWWRGDVDRALLIRTGLIVIMAIALRMGWWLLMVAVEQLRDRLIRRPAPRLLAFVLTSGVAFGAMVGEADAQGVSCAESFGRIETTACPPSPVLVIPHSSRLDLAGTAVVSGLIGAGVALRLKARDMQDRRKPGDELTVGREESDLPIELATEALAAEQSLKQMMAVVRYIVDATPDNRIRHVVDEKNGWIVVEFTDPVKQLSRSEIVSSRALRVRTSEIMTTEEDLFDPRLPPLLHVGHSLSGEVWISMDEYRSFGVDCSREEGDRVWRHLCQSLIVGPSFESHGVVTDHDLGSYPTRRCFVASEGASVDEVVERVGRSIAVVHDGLPAPSLRGIHRVVDGQVENGLKMIGEEWRLLPADVAIRPVGSNFDEVTSIKALLGVKVDPIVVEPPIESESNSVWDFMACVLGPPRLVDCNHEPVRFERGKAEELVIWLAFHPEQRKRSLARSALWLSPVQDATFSNITAAARRSMNAVRTPADGGAWVGITMSDDLPLAEGVITDVSVLQEAVSQTRLRPEDVGVERLRSALELVRGVPFAGSTYTWSDGIGVCGEAATLVVQASVMMAEMCHETGDIAGVYWATAKGLLALPGHEDLVAMRLRVQATQGDHIAMRVEWESFRRALASEWGDAEPSTKMIDLWRQLTAGWSTQESQYPREDSH